PSKWSRKEPTAQQSVELTQVIADNHPKPDWPLGTTLQTAPSKCSIRLPPVPSCPTAQQSRTSAQPTPDITSSPVGLGKAPRVQVAPSQCSVKGWNPPPGGKSVPTAQQSEAATQVMSYRSAGTPGSGTTTSDQ